MVRLLVAGGGGALVALALEVLASSGPPARADGIPGLPLPAISGSGSGAGSADTDTGTDPDIGADTSGGGAGIDAFPGASPVSLGVVDGTTVATTRAVGGNALARTGIPAAGLALLALLMMLAGAAICRVGARR